MNTSGMTESQTNRLALLESYVSKLPSRDPESMRQVMLGQGFSKSAAGCVMTHIADPTDAGKRTKAALAVHATFYS